MNRQTDFHQARILNTLAHKRRIKIFRVLLPHLSTGLHFTRLEASAGMCRSTLTHHLRVMEQGGLLTRHPIGARIFYRLSLAGLSGNLAQLLAVIENRSQQKAPVSTY